MFASIHLPAFHLQCALRDDPDGDAPLPIAILEPSGTASERSKARIIQLSPEARQQGVEPHMTATQGLARCAELLLLDRDLTAEAAAQSDLLACAESFTADFESTAPGTATLDLHGNLLSPHSLATQAIAWLAATKLRSSIGTANNPDLAALAAKTSAAGAHQHIPDEPDRIRQFLTPLPLESITASRELIETLHLWGIHTLGQLISLERSEVTGRLGPRRRFSTITPPATSTASSSSTARRAPSPPPPTSNMRSPASTR